MVLVDAGAGYSFSHLVNNIRLVGLVLADLSFVLATSRHVNHIGSLAEFRERHKAKTMAREPDTEAIEIGKGVGAEFYGIEYQPCPVDIKLMKKESELRL